MLTNCNIQARYLYYSGFSLLFALLLETPLLLNMDRLNYQTHTETVSHAAYQVGCVRSNFSTEKLVLRFRRPFMPRT